MNEKLNEFINAIGMTTEIWIITYSSFQARGLSDEEAMKHTKEFMQSFLEVMLKYGKGDAT